jgi:hypothetical protein
MKAISVQQPWAWAIVHAGKDIDNRSWRTHHRGWVAIHASGKVQREWSMPHGVHKPAADKLVLGAIVGVARLTDVVDKSRSKWFEGPVGWVLEGPRRLRRPVPVKGRLGLWTVPPSVAAQVTRQLGTLSI